MVKLTFGGCGAATNRVSREAASLGLVRLLQRTLKGYYERGGYDQRRGARVGEVARQLTSVGKVMVRKKTPPAYGLSPGPMIVACHLQQREAFSYAFGCVVDATRRTGTCCLLSGRRSMMKAGPGRGRGAPVHGIGLPLSRSSITCKSSPPLTLLMRLRAMLMKDVGGKLWYKALWQISHRVPPESEKGF